MIMFTKNSSAGVTGFFVTSAERIDDTNQFWFAEKFFPDLAVIGGDGEQIGNAACFGFRMERDSGKPQTADNADGTKKIEPVL